VCIVFQGIIIDRKARSIVSAVQFGKIVEDLFKTGSHINLVTVILTDDGSGTNDGLIDWGVSARNLRMEGFLGMIDTPGTAGSIIFPYPGSPMNASGIHHIQDKIHAFRCPALTFTAHGSIELTGEKGHPKPGHQSERSSIQQNVLLYAIEIVLGTVCGNKCVARIIMTLHDTAIRFPSHFIWGSNLVRGGKTILKTKDVTIIVFPDLSIDGVVDTHEFLHARDSIGFVEQIEHSNMRLVPKIVGNGAPESGGLVDTLLSVP
jgi:hypothetical protein